LFFDVQRFDFRPGPGRLAQEFQAGLDARLIAEAADIDALGKAVPAEASMQLDQDGLQRHAMKGVFCLSHGALTNTRA
jgi:hypothetical protein